MSPPFLRIGLKRKHSYRSSTEGKHPDMGQCCSSRDISGATVPELFAISTLQMREHMWGNCDVDITVDEYRFPAHKEVLMEHSRYFKSMFTQFGEKNREQVELKDIVEPGLMGQVIRFMYFTYVEITPSNVQDLLSVSNYLQMDTLQALCVKFIQDRIDKKNCVSLYLYTQSTGPYELQCYAEDFILQHFEQITFKAKDFVNLSKDQLISLISNDRLLVSSEGAVYRAVMHWVGAEPKARNVHLPTLLEHVHFPLMSLDEAEQLARNQAVKRNKNLAIALDEAKNYFAKSTDEKIDYWSTKSKPGRWPKIFVVMRMYWKNLPMEYYDFRSRQWNVLCPVQNWRSCTAIVSHRCSIYLLGGEEADPDSPTGSRTVNRVTRYDCERQKWTSAPSMQLARRWSGAVVLENIIYVIGGIGGKGGTYEKRLDSVECLDLSAKNPKWKLLSSMSTPRSSHTVEALDGKIYVVGGGDGKEWLCSSEVYNPKKNKWTSIAPLKAKRWKCGLVVLSGYLYAVGGMDSPKAGFWGAPLKSVERYFPATDTWQEVAAMNEARFGCAVVAYQGRIYASGGFGQGKSILNSTECYDPEADKWTKMPQMKKMCGFVGGILVDRPIHMEEGDKE